MRWWHHAMIAGALTLLWDVPWFNALGGAVFAVGAWAWVLRRVRVAR